MVNLTPGDAYGFLKVGPDEFTMIEFGTLLDSDNVFPLRTNESGLEGRIGKS